jgi:hypothetical protein
VNDLLLRYLERRNDLDEAEAEAVRSLLSADPQACAWLREQLGMEDLLARLHQPERGEFANRVRYVVGAQPAAAFIARVHGQAAAGDLRPSVRLRTAGARRAPAPRHRRTLWAGAAAAALLLVLGAALLASGHRGVPEVIQGSVVVADHEVQRVPDGAGFTVAGERAAVIRLDGASHASFAPASAGTISRDRATSAQVVQLDAGAGEFHVEAQGRMRVETAGGTVSGSGDGQDANFTATLGEAPMAEVGTGTAPGALPGEELTRPGGHHAAARAKTLAVAVRTGQARVEFKGQPRIIIEADQARVFSADGRTLTAERVLRGVLKFFPTAGTGTNANIVITGHEIMRTIAVSPATRVRLDGTEATLGDLHPGDHVEAHAAKDGPLLATLLVVTRPKQQLGEPPRKPAAHPAEH